MKMSTYDGRVTPNESKMCNTCHLVKSFIMFRKIPSGMAYRNRCRACDDKIESARISVKRSTNPEFAARLTGSHRCYVGTRRGYSSTRISSLRRKAKKQGLDFDLDITWFEEKLNTGYCELSGIVFNYTDLNFAPSVDRIDPRLGYIRSNCRVVLFCLNAFRGTMTDNQCRDIARALINGTNL